MPMPNNLVLIRHGKSEPNLIHASERDGQLHEKHNDVYDRPDWQQRLCAEGVLDAVAAGDVLRRERLGLDIYDRRYVSTFLRARETAFHIDPESEQRWFVDDRLKERDWGEYGATPHSERSNKFVYAYENNKTNKWYARLNGGESLADGVLMRSRDFQTTLHRDMANKNVLVVAHGETMLTFRYLIERMLPEEWMEAYEDKAQDIRNGTILHYSRQHPVDVTHTSDSMQWMRMLYPRDMDNSPFGGKWREIPIARTFTAAELALQLEIVKPLTEREI